MSKLIFIVGGCRSGKTSYCMKLAKDYKKVVYLATAEILDSEMQRRVRKHREDRPSHWTTVEEPININSRLRDLDTSTQIVIIDCLTLYVSNLILMNEDSEKLEERIIHTIQDLLHTIKQINPIVAIVSNDTGSGIVPDNQLARLFRDISGFINQLVAREADEVYKMEVGIPCGSNRYCMIPIYNKNEINGIRESGKVLNSCFLFIKEIIKEGMTLKEIDNLVYNFLENNNSIPAVLDYKGYPASICASINDAVIHGIPDGQILENGDIVGIDIAIEHKGWFSDKAYTFTIGQIDASTRKLLDVTQNALKKGIRAARNGNHIGDISNAIQTYVENNNFSVIRTFVGHGIGRKLHQNPPVPNYGKKSTGPVLKNGMVLAIEPMVNEGTHEVKILNDGWTVVTKDGKKSAHFENTVVVGNNGGIILTN